MSTVMYLIVLGVIVLTIVYVACNFLRIKRMPEGTKEMSEMADVILPFNFQLSLHWERGTHHAY